MKNLHILPTDKPSRLLYFGTSKELTLQVNPATFRVFERSTQNIYITNDEYVGLSYYVDGKLVRKGVVDDKDYWSVRKDYKKIILTTDLDLIKDGVQEIDDEFLEWFVKNPSCEEVKVENVYKTASINFGNQFNYYKIIIPKEECDYTALLQPVGTREETLEEVAHKMLDDYGIKSMGQSIGVLEVKKLMVKMAKWQKERMYSEEDLREAFRQGQDNMDYSDTYGWDSKLTEQEWFDKIKKK
jgi:hypothetical protein